MTRAPLDALPADALSLADYACLAQPFSALPTWAWLEGGSAKGQALEAARAAFAAHAIYNRIGIDFRHGSTATTMLGQRLDHPVMLAPLGFHRLVHPDGEAATAAGALDTLMVVSTMASVPMEDIARAAAGPLWFQLYLQPCRADTLRLIRRAEAAGLGAIMVTLDTPIQPASISAQKAGFALPTGIEAVHLAGCAPPPPPALAPGQNAVFQGMMAHAPTMADLAWLRSETRLPLLAKGVSHPDDAAALIALGFDGIVVSNHGGRALDAAPAPLAVLPAIRAALGPGATILIDGGIRTGSDVFKALALGANAVMIGRPQLHALALAGSLGVAHMLRLLRAELEVTMALAGCPTVAAITPAALFPQPFGNPSC